MDDNIFMCVFNATICSDFPSSFPDVPLTNMKGMMWNVPADTAACINVSIKIKIFMDIYNFVLIMIVQWWLSKTRARLHFVSKEESIRKCLAVSFFFPYGQTRPEELSSGMALAGRELEMEKWFGLGQFASITASGIASVRQYIILKYLLTELNRTLYWSEL